VPDGSPRHHARSGRATGPCRVGVARVPIMRQDCLRGGAHHVRRRGNERPCRLPDMRERRRPHRARRRRQEVDGLQQVRPSLGACSRLRRVIGATSGIPPGTSVPGPLAALLNASAGAVRALTRGTNLPRGAVRNGRRVASRRRPPQSVLPPTVGGVVTVARRIAKRSVPRIFTWPTKRKVTDARRGVPTDLHSSASEHRCV
jgi:hypothetical protein